MTDRRFFGTNKLVEDYLTNLEKIKTLDGGWTIMYIDRSTNKEWIKYSVDPGRGYYFNLMLTTPQMTTKDIMDVAFESKYLDEVGAAAHRLFLEEQFDQKEYRGALLRRLIQFKIENLDKAEKERLRTIIEASQLTDRLNHRIKIGDTVDEVKRDADFFEQTSKKAKQFLEQLEK